VSVESLFSSASHEKKWLPCRVDDVYLISSGGGDVSLSVAMEGETLKKQIKKRLRDGAALDDLLENWPQCHHFMKTKYRFCNLKRSPGSLFCGTHRPSDEAVPKRVLRDAQAHGFTEIIRIPCPIDPTHSIFNCNLESHLKICNTGARIAFLEKQPYYCKDCNSGNNLPSVSSEEGQGEGQSPSLDLLLLKVRELYHSQVANEIEEPSSDTPTGIDRDELFKIVAGDAVSFDRLRHAHQDVHIVTQMAAKAMFPSPSSSRSDGASSSLPQLSPPHHVYVELGAGKGMLGLAVKSAAEQACSGASSLVMVERTGVHRKADKTLRENSDLAFMRIRMDIRDCLLAGLPGVAAAASSEPTPGDCLTLPPPVNGTPPAVVLVAKHLCGLATDISLRSLESLRLSSTPPSSSPEPFYGVSIATCCHHACSWKDYVNPSWLLACGFTSQEFQVLSHWSGWAHTLGSGVRLPKERPLDPSAVAISVADESERARGEEEEVEHSLPPVPVAGAGQVSYRPQGLSYEEMSEVGKMVKRILDHGRVLYLRAQGFTVCQRRYCDSELSPECYLLLATRGTK
jgi:tRNA:m4X modification enzyme